MRQIRLLLVLCVLVAGSTACASTIRWAGSSGSVLVTNATQESCQLFQDGKEKGILGSGDDVRLFFGAMSHEMSVSCRKFGKNTLLEIATAQFRSRQSRYGYQSQFWEITSFRVARDDE